MNALGKQRKIPAVNTSVVLRMRAMLCLFIAFLLATCMVPFTTSAIADDASDANLTTVGTSGLRTASVEKSFNVSFPSATNYKSDLQVVLTYSDDLFAAKSDTYNDSLGYASVCLAVAAGNSSAEESYANKGKNIEAFLGDSGIGCENVSLNDAYKNKPGTENVPDIGAAIGWKSIAVNESGASKSYKLFVVGVRGISYEAEWGDNMKAGTKGDHEGFAAARDTVLEFILPYIKSHTETGDNVKIWISGYSRGGAVANMVGGYLDSQLKNGSHLPKAAIGATEYDLADRNLTTGDVYCYTANAPQGVDEAKVRENAEYCKGIHNLINPDDWISQTAMSWWGLSRYGIDHDVSSDQRTGTINRDVPMLPDKAAAVKAMMGRLKKINPNAAYTAPWFKQYYFSLWKAGIVEDTGGDGNKFISKGTELIGKQGRYFEEFGRFLFGAIGADQRGEYVSRFQADFSYLAKLLMGLDLENQAKLGTVFKAHLTSELREQLKMPSLSLDNLGADALAILNLIMNKESDFATVCEKTLKGTFDELGVTYNAEALKSAATTFATVINRAVTADNSYFYHLVTIAKSMNGIAQAHYPEAMLAWWEGSDTEPIPTPEPTPTPATMTLRFYANMDDQYEPSGEPLFTQELIEDETVFVSNAEPPTIDGEIIDDGVFYYGDKAPVREGYTFVGWQTATSAEQAEYGEYYNAEDYICYGDFDAGDVQDGKCNLFAVWIPEGDSIENYVARMPMEEKIPQMIVPAMRTWDGVNVTSLNEADELAEALRAHDYGGVILYGPNVSSVEQTVRLTTALQVNNAKTSFVPYLMCVDGEGGVVTRLTMGTRMNGSMAIGATGASAESNALKTGQVIGGELAAAGFNVDFAPVIDVNSNAANPVIGTRAFSDNPQIVSALGVAFAQGLSDSGVAVTYKHFPGHGDTSTDSHTSETTVDKTYDELKQVELIPFQSAIANDADIIMTAHITLPKVDGTKAYDGVSYYPATLSAKVLTDILREDMGYQGVVVTDALEMDAIQKVQLVEGDLGSVQYGVNVAIKVIEAGGDILLVPTDLKNNNAVQYYDDYIDALITYAEENPDFAERVDESVTRILRLKEKYGILDMDVSGDDVDQKVADAQKTIGSEEHHAVESSIAKQAITLLKNDNYALPLSGHEGNVVIFGRDSDHVKTIEYAIQQMQATGLIDEDAYEVNLENGTTTGSSSSDVRITIGFYRDYPEGGNPVVHYTDEMKQAVAEADSVVTLSVNYNLAALQPTADQYQGVSQIMDDAHAVGASFVLLSCNLPYDAARYQGADAIMCCYMSAGLDAGPIDSGAGKLGAYNANVVCALESMFDAFAPAGTLPVNAPAVTEAADGMISYSSEVLYERGSGLKSFNYAFVEGAGGVYEQGSATGLHFKANARHDKLVSLQVDGAEPDAASYAISAGSTNVDLSADYLDTLAAGEHQIDAIYEYGTGEFTVSTTFTVTTKASPTPTPTPDVNPDSTKGSSVTTKGASAKSATTGDAVPVIAIVIIVLVAIAAIVLALVARKRQGSSDAVDDDR